MSVLDSLLSKRWQTSGRLRTAIWRGPLQGTKLYPLPPSRTKLYPLPPLCTKLF